MYRAIYSEHKNTKNGFTLTIKNNNPPKSDVSLRMRKVSEDLKRGKEKFDAAMKKRSRMLKQLGSGLINIIFSSNKTSQ